jgi:hypothetical protein
LTTANITAIAAFLDVIAKRPGNGMPSFKLLSDTNKAQLYFNA